MPDLLFSEYSYNKFHSRISIRFFIPIFHTLDPLPILIFIVFVFALAFFAGTEIPLMSV